MSDQAAFKVRTISILGGTGKEGRGLAYRWAKAGYHILIGSRQVEKAQDAARTVRELFDRPVSVEGKTNPEAAQEGDIIIMTVPFAAHRAMLESIRPYVQGKIFVDVSVPLVPPKVTKVQMPEAGSAAQEAQQILGEGVPVVAAFQNISYENLLKNEEVQCDVLVCGTGKANRQVVLSLVKDAGLVGWDAGVIENSVVVEGLTSILIGLNKQYGVEASGIRITGIERQD